MGALYERSGGRWRPSPFACLALAITAGAATIGAATSTDGARPDAFRDSTSAAYSIFPLLGTTIALIFRPRHPPIAWFPPNCATNHTMFLVWVTIAAPTPAATPFLERRQVQRHATAPAGAVPPGSALERPGFGKLGLVGEPPAGVMDDNAFPWTSEAATVSAIAVTVPVPPAGCGSRAWALASPAATAIRCG